MKTKEKKGALQSKGAEKCNSVLLFMSGGHQFSSCRWSLCKNDLKLCYQPTKNKSFQFQNESKPNKKTKEIGANSFKPTKQKIEIAVKDK